MKLQKLHRQPSVSPLFGRVGPKWRRGQLQLYTRVAIPDGDHQHRSLPLVVPYNVYWHLPVGSQTYALYGEVPIQNRALKHPPNQDIVVVHITNEGFDGVAITH